VSAIYRPGRGSDHHVVRGRDHYVGHDRGSHDFFDRHPSGDRVQYGRGLLPSTPYRIVRRRGAVQPSELPRTVVESNSLHATCNAFLRDTNNPPPTRIQDLALRVEAEPPEAAVAPQS
jgi:hypothetical protein